MPVLKVVAAVGGDVVTVTREGVFLGGELLQVAAPLADRQARPLDPLPVGEYRLGPQELWLYTPAPRSWDSRFYGPLDVSAVLGRVRSVWTWAPNRHLSTAPPPNPRRPHR